ncbi:TPA: hypothetical protein DCZ15_00280 [Candidatus Falkowbacteria bacterium]|nr:MAG: hypothetical protein UV95_C0001G0287 [Candidatus Falkowbacteria bacterium GW2011_GWF2_43_32]HBA36298.1 hypothetical protein [Candidatus Falkowbacteria bacterium]
MKKVYLSLLVAVVIIAGLYIYKKSTSILELVSVGQELTIEIPRDRLFLAEADRMFKHIDPRLLAMEKNKINHSNCQITFDVYDADCKVGQNLADIFAALPQTNRETLTWEEVKIFCVKHYASLAQGGRVNLFLVESSEQQSKVFVYVDPDGFYVLFQLFEYDDFWIGESSWRLIVPR